MRASKNIAVGLALICLGSVAAWAQPNTTAASPEVSVFVSFSLPVNSLAALLRDADRINAPVVLRGLVDNNFKTTFARTQAIIIRSGGGGLSIDPMAFTRYGIQHVPTVLVSNTSDNCFDSLTGDIPLAAALTTIRDHGECHFPLDPLITLLRNGDAHA